MSDIVLGDERLEFIAEEILIRGAGGETIALSVKDGNLTLGGAGRDGDLMFTDKSGNVTIALNGERGALHLGGAGEDGDITVRDASFAQSAHIDGSKGDMSLRGALTAARVTELSDATLKTQISPLEEAAALLEKLRAVRFRLKDRPDEARIGLIAQEVAAEVPEAVIASDSGLAVDHSALVALLLGTVQELQAEIQALKSKLG